MIKIQIEKQTKKSRNYNRKTFNIRKILIIVKKKKENSCF